MRRDERVVNEKREQSEEARRARRDWHKQRDRDETEAGREVYDKQREGKQNRKRSEANREAEAREEAEQDQPISLPSSPHRRSSERRAERPQPALERTVRVRVRGAGVRVVEVRAVVVDSCE